MIGAPARSAISTKPPRPKRCSRYRSEKSLPAPLAPSGKTATSSSCSSRRDALYGEATTPPTLRMATETNGSVNAQRLDAPPAFVEEVEQRAQGRSELLVEAPLVLVVVTRRTPKRPVDRLA